METGYLQGDRETVNAVVAVLAAAAYNDEDMKTKVLSLDEEDKHLYSSVNAFIPVFNSNKKLVAAFIG